MSCTATIDLVSAANTSLPISGTVSWTDANGSQVMNVNQPFPGQATTVTLTGVSSVQMTAMSPGFISQTKTVTCDQNTPFELSQSGGGGGGSGGGQGGGGSLCFIATAAFGTESAPEVKSLQEFRDNVLRRTRWGDRLFEDFSKHYYRISPSIADEMRRDPELRRVVRWAIVEPWLNYLRLMIARPDFQGMDFDGLEPKLGAFLSQIKGDAEKWLTGIELPKSFKDRNPEEAVHELNVVLGLVLLRTAGRAYLEDLKERGELPLQYPRESEAKLRRALADAGRSEEEINIVLYGTQFTPERRRSH